LAASYSRSTDGTGLPSPTGIRRRVLKSAFRITSTLGAVAWVTCVWYAVVTGATYLALAATLVYLWLFAPLSKRRLSLRVRVAGLLVPVFILAVRVLPDAAPFGAALFWMLAIMVVAATIFLIRSLEAALEATYRVGVELESERAKLIEANGELERQMEERRRIEAERARLAAAVEQAGTLIIILDLRWCIVYVNPAFERVTGFTRDEAGGRPIDVTGGLGEDGDTRRAVETAAADGYAWSGRLRNRRRDGSSYDVEATISALRDGAGRPTSYVAVMSDISREVVLETQLRQSQKLEAIGTLAGGIAHDFNNLLVPIIGCTEAALERIPQNDETHDLLDDVHAAAERARELVSQILTFSRRSEPRREPRQAAPVMREGARLLRAMLPAGIRIEERINDDVGAVRADATELHQVIMNLATNAYHAMRRSGGILTLSLESVPPDRLPDAATAHPAPAYICLTVGDTGVGMDEKALERVFDPFYTTKAAGEGTGLGLAMVHGTVAALGGAIDVKSWPGAGTIVRVYLPRTAEEVKPAAAPVPIRSGRGQHVLLVDDELAVRRVALRMLERGGFRVTDAASADEALRKFSARPELFDVVLTDFNMPGMNGIELAAAIREIRSDTPVILSSGFVDAESIQYAERCGIRQIVNKPFSPSEIASAVSGAVAAGAAA